MSYQDVVLMLTYADTA